jgi:5'-nucleotidase
LPAAPPQQVVSQPQPFGQATPTSSPTPLVRTAQQPFPAAPQPAQAAPQAPAPLTGNPFPGTTLVTPTPVPVGLAPGAAPRGRVSFLIVAQMRPGTP